jgi:Domain of unknown function (DUF4926)
METLNHKYQIIATIVCLGKLSFKELSADICQNRDGHSLSDDSQTAIVRTGWIVETGIEDCARLIVREEKTMQPPDLLDVIELLVNLLEHGFQVGAQGTIVEQYDDQSYEVEFTNGSGETIALVVLQSQQFVVAWRSAIKTWVPVADRFEALVATLPEETLLEVFDFARFVYSRRLAG